MICFLFWQQAAAPISVPDNLIVWGGMSLALLFNILVTALRAVGVIKDDSRTKKLVGGYLAAAGGVVGLAYAFTTGVADTIQIITYAASGALAGVTSVGFHSTLKNTKEGLLITKSK